MARHGEYCGPGKVAHTESIALFMRFLNFHAQKFPRETTSSSTKQTAITTMMIIKIIDNLNLILFICAHSPDQR